MPKFSSSYDNLLANVPTDLWNGDTWKKSYDGARFDITAPATEALSPKCAGAPDETYR